MRWRLSLAAAGEDPFVLGRATYPSVGAELLEINTFRRSGPYATFVQTAARTELSAKFGVESSTE